MKMREIVISIGLIAAVAATRFLPHPMNFSPVMSVALFGSAVFFNRYLGIAVALAAMALSDLFLGAHSTLPFVYLAMVLAGVLGFTLRNRRSPVMVLGMALAGSVLFFIVTNLGVFLMQDLYPRTAAGLVSCYTMALPFFKNSLAGDLVFTAVLFSLHFVLVRRNETRALPTAA